MKRGLGRNAWPSSTLQQNVDLVQVDAEQFKGDADVVAEGERFQHVDDVAAVVDVLFAQVFQDADLLLRLSVKPLLVANDLERHLGAVLVIFRLHHLTEASSSETLCFSCRRTVLKRQKRKHD